MATTTGIENSQPQNPFTSQGNYSPAAVELMRALSEQRKQSGQKASSPAQVLSAVRDLGYEQPADSTLDISQEATRFVRAMTAFQQKHELAYPSCEDLLSVLNQLGYSRHAEELLTVVDGLAIDRRRREEDARNRKEERRASLEPSPQELMELTEDEHLFLDALKELREQTEREFASSEELLSIVWDLGYRPNGEDDLPVQWLDDDDRRKQQIAFTNRIESRIANSEDGNFLTCRALLEIVAELGFQKQS